jgi:cell division protein FtsI/penicillin-binding protein 2
MSLRSQNRRRIWRRRKMRFAIRLTAATLLLALTAGLCAAALVSYRDGLAKNREWTSRVVLARDSRLEKAVFDIALSHGLIRASRTNRSIIEADCEPSEATLQGAMRAARSLLCDSPQGADIRAEIEAWRRASDVIAVRDTRNPDDKCRESATVAINFVPSGCKPNEWRAERADDDLALPWTPRAIPSPADYVMIADEFHRHAGDWAMAVVPSSGSSRPTTYRLTTDVDVFARRGRALTIDLVGSLQAIEIVGHGRLSINPDKLGNVQSLGPFRAVVDILCRDGSDCADAASATPARRPVRRGRQRGAATFSYTVEIWAAEGGRSEARRTVPARSAKVRLNVNPVPGPSSQCRPDRPLRRTVHLELRCPTGDSTQIVWNRTEHIIEQPTVKPRAPFRIVAAGGGSSLELVDEKTGLTTPQAVDLGLDAMIGLGAFEWGSLSYALARSAPAAQPQMFRLTIDPAMQKLANTTLRQYMCMRQKNCREERRAVLVVMDAEKAPGAIRALAAASPASQAQRKGLHEWDILALEYGKANRGGMGWRALDKFNVPGSTFKGVTAAAAIETVLANDKSDTATVASIGRLLRGDMSFGRSGRHSPASPAGTVESSVEFLGLRSPSQVRSDTATCNIEGGSRAITLLPVPDDRNPYYCAKNFALESYEHAAKAPSRTGCPAGGASANRERLGLCEALADSSNLFFGGLARKLQQVASAREPFPLTRMAERLSFGSGSFDLTRGVPLAQKLRANPVRIDLAQPAGETSVSRVDPGRVVRSGFGQEVEATPLAMATIYASLSRVSSTKRKQTVRPSLVELSYDQDGCPTQHKAPGECEPVLPQSAALADGEVYLDAFRKGLNAVIKTGTASGSFARTCARRRDEPLCREPERLFVKTGTANVDTRKGGKLSLWLAGWVEGRAGRGISSRLAFACWISHGENDTGGGSCGPLLFNFLLELDRQAARP